MQETMGGHRETISGYEGRRDRRAERGQPSESKSKPAISVEVSTDAAPVPGRVARRRFVLRVPSVAEGCPRQVRDLSVSTSCMALQ
jgi:hypothetical protein